MDDPLSPRPGDLFRATARCARDDDLEGEAAKIAFFFFLSLFPFLLIAVALAGLVGGSELFLRITVAARTAMPPSSWQFIDEVLGEIMQRDRPGALSAGIALTLWSATSGIVALIESLNRIWRVPETRGWWRRRGVALVALIIALAVLVIAALLFGAGRRWVDGTELEAPLRVARWPLTFIMMASAVWFAYHYLPGRPRGGASVLWAAIGATVAWVVATALFGLYVRSVGQYGKSYGTIGAVIVLVLWFYISAFVILLGAEAAAVLERVRQRRDGAAASP